VPSICGQVRARSIVGRGRQANHQELSSLSYAGINDRGGGNSRGQEFNEATGILSI